MFYFNYLENTDTEISNDAYKEFGNAGYKEFELAAKLFSREKVISWLKNATTPSFKMGLYASILGHCGKPEDAQILKQLLEDPEKQSACAAAWPEVLSATAPVHRVRQNARFLPSAVGVVKSTCQRSSFHIHFHRRVRAFAREQ